MIWVLCDLSYMAYRAMHTMGDLAVEDLSTGVLFGFFRQLRDVCSDPRITSNRVAVFVDSRKSHRKDAFPTYKEKRAQDRTDEDWARIRIMREQIRLLHKEILPAIGIPVYRQTGLESDDLLAQVSQQLTPFAETRQAVIVTADGDLYQSINPFVHWFDPQRNNYYDPETFEEKKGILPKMWGEVKCLAGCNTDNVPGIPGVGEKTAIKCLLGTLPLHHKVAKRIGSKKGYKIRLRNRGLVCLPHPKTREVKLVEPEYDMKAFWKVCKRYHFQSFLDERGSWERFFHGKFDGARVRSKTKKKEVPSGGFEF